MPKLSSLTKKSLTVVVKYNDGEINLEVKPNKMSTRQAIELRSVDPTNQGATLAALARTLAAIIVKWDVLGDDNKPLPISEATMLDIFPPDLIVAMSDAITEASRPNDGKSAT